MVSSSLLIMVNGGLWDLYMNGKEITNQNLHRKLSRKRLRELIVNYLHPTYLLSNQIDYLLDEILRKKTYDNRRKSKENSR